MDPAWIAIAVAAAAGLVLVAWFVDRQLRPGDGSAAAGAGTTARAAPTSDPSPASPDEDTGTTLAETAAASSRQVSYAGVPVAPAIEIDVTVDSDPGDVGLRDDDPTGPVPLILVSATGRTDQGRKRKHNEDAFCVMPDHGLYAIADGMGGYAAGEVASQMAIDVLATAFTTGDFGAPPIPGLPPRGDELVRAIQTANGAILRQARENEAQSGMGTTIVSARFAPNRKRVYLAHVGDSRAYRLRTGQFVQLTADHTLGAAGVTGPAANKLSRAVGVFDEVEVDLNIDEPQKGDFYLLCSDGLFKMVPESDIQAIIERAGDLETAVRTLVEEANARGGKDNVSVVLVRVDDPNMAQA